MRRGPRWSQNAGGPLAHAAGALVVGLSGPKTEVAPTPMRRGPRWMHAYIVTALPWCCIPRPYMWFALADVIEDHRIYTSTICIDIYALCMLCFEYGISKGTHITYTKGYVSKSIQISTQLYFDYITG